MGEDVSFRHPPVIETVLGIQFKRLDAITNAHLGAFWFDICQDWPSVTDAQALDEQYEVFERPKSWGRGFHVKLTQEASSRLQIRNASADRMIQVQNCRIDYNWLGQAGGEYPRYKRVRPEFDKALEAFLDFIRKNGLGEPVPNQWEVTYVNHIPKGITWAEARGWSGVFRGLPGLAHVPCGLALEGLGGHWHFEIEPQKGRLHVEIQHGHLESKSGDKLLIMKLTARGPINPELPINEAVDAGLNLGHNTIVESFRDLTSDSAHETWNRTP